jgi:hypothetical protein
MKYAATHKETREIYHTYEAVPTSGYYVEEEYDFFEISDEDATLIDISATPYFYVEGTPYSLMDFDTYIENKNLDEAHTKIETHFSNSLDSAKKYMKMFYAKKRLKLELGGINVGGLSIRTDRFTVERIYQARMLAKEDPTYNTEWKMSDYNFETLDAPTIVSIADAITLHLKTSFAREKTINDEINAATTIEELKSIEW